MWEEESGLWLLRDHSFTFTRGPSSSGCPSWLSACLNCSPEEAKENTIYKPSIPCLRSYNEPGAKPQVGWVLLSPVRIAP